VREREIDQLDLLSVTGQWAAKVCQLWRHDITSSSLQNETIRYWY